MTPGQKLIAWRKRRKLSQRDAAELVGVSQPSWQAYEAGGVPRTTVASTIERVTDGAVLVADWSEREALQSALRGPPKSRRRQRVRSGRSVARAR